MLSLLKDILDNREDAYARALATAEKHISEGGGDWYGVGAKGSFLLLMGGAVRDAEQGAPYLRAGYDLLTPALAEAGKDASIEAHLLHFLAGCAFAGSEGRTENYRRACDEFSMSDMGRSRLEPWCADWCQILLASAAQAAGDEAASRAHFQTLSNRDAETAVALFEKWTNRSF